MSTRAKIELATIVAVPSATIQLIISSLGDYNTPFAMIFKLLVMIIVSIGLTGMFLYAIHRFYDK